MSKLRLSIQEEHLAEIMATMGISDADLAKRLGILPTTFANLWSLGFPSERLRLRIESALGFRAVWSKPQVVAARQRIFNQLGFDVVLVKKAVLLRHAMDLGVTDAVRLNHQDLISAFIGKFSVQPSFNEKKH